MSVKDPNHEETVGKINYKKPSTKNVEIVNVIQPKTQQVTKFSGDTTEDCATDELANNMKFSKELLKCQLAPGNILQINLQTM
ncbi:Hypothetical protein FKW44_006902 [Caligus rogercresseyi]|uniref:Uncharacterized protein n=1 Tax=Caligus rogercresseyi TaxID=217165 RepID=A0A7T8KDZ0_CALRO|nr:Hypothetical protein FKW44_006902 [Caligus rogercresseyi]